MSDARLRASEVEGVRSPSAAGSPFRLRLPSVEETIMVLGILFVALLIVVPLGSVVMQAVFPDAFIRHPNLHFNAAALLRVLRIPQDYHMLADSVLLSIGAALAATALGTLVAWVIGRTDLPGGRAWSALVWCGLLLPSFLFAEGWEFILQRGGLLSLLIKEPNWLSGIFGNPWGVAAVLALKFFPFAYLTVSVALPWLGGELEAAARTLGAGTGRVWRKIYLPLLLPFLVSSIAIVFADVLSDFGVAVTVAESQRFPLLTYGIYTQLYTVPTDFAAAGALSLLLGVAVAVALLSQTLVLRHRRFATLHTGFRPPVRISLGRFRLPALIGLVLFFAAALGLPVGAIILEAFLRHPGYGLPPTGFTLANFIHLQQTGGPDAASLVYSLRVALVVATAAVLFGTLLAYFGTQRPGWLGQWLQGLALWTISVPGIILAAGYVFTWNEPWLARVHLALYGTVWALGLAYVAGGLPYVLRFQLGAFQQLDRRLLAAARVLGAGVGSLLRRVVVPLLAESVLSLWLFLLAWTVFELPSSDFLYPPGHPTLAVAINRYYDSSRYGRGTALSVLAAALLIVLVLIVRAVVSRLLPGRRLRLDRDAQGPAA